MNATLVLLFDSAAILVDGIDEDKSRRRAVNELTEAALAAERCFADLGRGMDSTLRRWAEGIGFEVSATIRVHQQLLLDPGHGKHVAALHSLVNGITQLSVGNYDPFLRGLPERRSRRPLWQKMLYRLSIPAILIGSALYLPSLFPGAIPADSLSTFRATLITAGVFAFLSPNLDEARSILLDALKK